MTGTDWHVEIGKRLISLDTDMKQLIIKMDGILSTLRALVEAVESNTQEMYLGRTESKNITLILSTILEENRDMKKGVDGIYG